MNTPLELKPPAGNNKTLWVVVGILGVAVLAMGATLIRLQSQPTEPGPLVGSALTQAAAPTASGAATAAAAPITTVSADSSAGTGTPSKLVATPEKALVSVQNKSPAHINKANHATDKIAVQTAQAAPPATAAPTPVRPQSPEPAVARAPAKPICADCGTVESVTPVERDGAASGVGVVAGGVLGAVVGNQVGGGDGKTLATILGAVGGGMAGNAVEKKMKKVTHYEVTVRMEDGSSRTVQQSTPASVGAQVTVDGNTLTRVTR